jgi:hypothetical protein
MAFGISVKQKRTENRLVMKEYNLAIEQDCSEQDLVRETRIEEVEQLWE